VNLLQIVWTPYSAAFFRETFMKQQHWHYAESSKMAPFVLLLQVPLLFVTKPDSGLNHDRPCSTTNSMAKIICIANQKGGVGKPRQR
jgi:hypothetical protein